MTPKDFRHGLAVRVAAHNLTGTLVTGGETMGVVLPDGTIQFFPAGEVEVVDGAPRPAPQPAAKPDGASRNSRSTLVVFARRMHAKLSGQRTDEARMLADLCTDYLRATGAAP